ECDREQRSDHRPASQAGPNRSVSHGSSGIMSCRPWWLENRGRLAAPHKRVNTYGIPAVLAECPESASLIEPSAKTLASKRGYNDNSNRQPCGKPVHRPIKQ